MDPIDIIYTPLDLPDCSFVNVDKFTSWLVSVYPQKEKSSAANKKMTSENVYKDQYPWDLTFGAYDGVFLDNCDKEFPEFARYCLEIFNIKRHELKSIVFLPVRDTVKGVAFWHRDLDLNGFRFYVINDRHEENPLLIRKTVEPYNKIPDLKTPLDDNDPRLQTEIFKCILPKSTQPYYVNNIRSVHSPCINVPGKRIAVFVAVKSEYEEQIRERNKNLILRSYEKFKDIAILY